MELSALAGVAHFRRCDLAALLVVSDVLTEPHNWEGVTSREFSQGVQVAAALAALVLLR
jgi:nucleoside phosphorylase